MNELQDCYEERDFSSSLSRELRGAHSYSVRVHFWREHDRRNTKEVEFYVIAPTARDALAIVHTRAKSVMRSHNWWAVDFSFVGGIFAAFEVYSIAWIGRAGNWSPDDLGEQQ